MPRSNALGNRALTTRADSSALNGLSSIIRSKACCGSDGAPRMATSTRTPRPRNDRAAAAEAREQRVEGGDDGFEDNVWVRRASAARASEQAEQYLEVGRVEPVSRGRACITQR